MKRIPHGREVGQALQSVRAAVKQALKRLNESAGQVMAKGDYARAEALAAKGREIQQFQAEVDALHKRWRELRGGTGSGAKGAATPVWIYYQPILKALSEAGGEARRADLEAPVERLMADTLQPGDREQMARGRERWQVMIRRARKHLVAEDWIEDGSGAVWKITDAGRRTGEEPLGPRNAGAE